jgi:hypothetical protein
MRCNCRSGRCDDESSCIGVARRRGRHYGGCRGGDIHDIRRWGNQRCCCRCAASNAIGSPRTPHPWCADARRRRRYGWQSQRRVWPRRIGLRRYGQCRRRKRLGMQLFRFPHQRDREGRCRHPQRKSCRKWCQGCLLCVPIPHFISVVACGPL